MQQILNNIPVRVSQVLLVLIGCLVINGCAYNPTSQPRLSQKDQDYLDLASRPTANSLGYDYALAVIGDYINNKSRSTVRMQPKSIGNMAGGAELPLNLTDMVITSLSHVAGKRFYLLPYDPQYISNDYATGGRGTRSIPNYILGGSITEFDKEINTSSRKIQGDALLGGGSTETDIGIGRNIKKKKSRVVLDLHLLDYNSHSVVPGAVVSNTINIIELEKDKDFGFAIYGSGLGVTGRIKHAQGYHRAVRNLVEYSVIQLLGKFYNIPYWEVLGMDAVDPTVKRALIRDFQSKSVKAQVVEIQRLLTGQKLTDVYGVRSGKRLGDLSLGVDGDYGWITHSFLQRFIQQQRPDLALSALDRFAANRRDFTPQTSRELMAVYFALKTKTASDKLAEYFDPQILNDPEMLVGEAVTSPKTFYNTFEKTENVHKTQVSTAK